VLLNGEPLATIDDDAVAHGLILIQCNSILSMQVEIDNIKLWMLDSEEPPTQTAEDLWAQSPHANSPSEAFPESVIQAPCAKCHSTSGFIDFLGADGSAVGIIDSETHPLEPIQCEACHSEPATGKDTVVMPSGVELTDMGFNSSLCMECHQGRNSLISLNAAIMEAAGVNDITEVDPDKAYEGLYYVSLHYSSAAGTRYGTEAKIGGEYEGKNYSGYFAHVPQYNNCDDCHDPHSLEVLVEACRGCHGEIDIGSDIKNEIKTFQDRLLVAIENYTADVAGVRIGYKPDAHPFYFVDMDEDGTISTEEAVTENRYNTWTPRLLRAAYNYYLSVHEPGAFAHNGRYMIQLLYDSIEDLNPEGVADLQREYQGAPTLVDTKIDSIQSYIQTTSPTFHDNFSETKPDWGMLGESYDFTDFVVNGVLNLDLERDTSELVSLNLRGHTGDLLAATDFELQFDYSAEEIGENTSIYVDFHWGAMYSYVGYNLHLQPAQGTWEMVKFGFPPQVIGSGQIPGSGVVEQWNNVELVAVGDLFAVTLNGERVGTFRDDEWTGDLNRIRVETADPVLKIKLDNLKLWNLGGVEFSTAAELYQPGGQSTMVQIPAGEFMMGSSASDSEARENEFPEHAVYLDDYWIDRMEVTNAMFADFLKDQGNQSEGGEPWYSAGGEKSRITQDGDQWTAAPGWEDHPVTLVTWYGAEAFCEWTGLRLPTEAEWEKAARGTDTSKTRRYPWGDEYIPERANLLGSSADGYETTAPVGSYPEGESPYGVLDMAGNVFEWVADWYEVDYYERSETNNPAGPPSGSGKVTRGGSYKENSIFGRSAARSGNDPVYSEVSETTGFRCASSTPPDQAQSLSEIIKNYTNSQTPTFEDDFSSIKSSWGYDSDGKGVLSFIGDGVLTVKMNYGDETKTFPVNNLIRAYDFALEYNFEKLSGYSLPTDFGVRFRSNKEQSSYYEFYSADGRNNARLTRIDESGARTILASSYAGIGIGNFYHVLIVVVGKHIEIYLNNNLLIAVEDDALSGEKNLFWFGSYGSVIIDNVKFWNLDGVDLE
jgi:formylglycine-generating enzyme required for sulfatase activity